MNAKGNSFAVCSPAESLTFSSSFMENPLVGKKSQSPDIPWQNAPKGVLHVASSTTTRPLVHPSRGNGISWLCLGEGLAAAFGTSLGTSGWGLINIPSWPRRFHGNFSHVKCGKYLFGGSPTGHPM